MLTKNIILLHFIDNNMKTNCQNTTYQHKKLYYTNLSTICEQSQNTTYQHVTKKCLLKVINNMQTNCQNTIMSIIFHKYFILNLSLKN